MKKQIFLLPIAAFLAIQAPTIAAPMAASNTTSTTCTIDASKGTSPIGMRNALTLKQIDADTVITYDSFPSNAGTFGGNRRATIATTRTVVLYSTPIATAREILLANASLYTELMGFKPDKGFKVANDLLTCTNGSATTTSTPKSIAALPDGTYSYWSGKPNPPDRKMTTDALLKSGGILYVFNKKSNAITGTFAPIDGETICVEGTLEGTRLTGMAYPEDGLGSPSTQLFSWHPSGYLQVGSWEPTKAAKKGHYHQAKLDLTAFSPVVLDRAFTPKASCTGK
jgi:hypothetical protein